MVLCGCFNFLSRAQPKLEQQPIETSHATTAKQHAPPPDKSETVTETVIQTAAQTSQGNGQSETPDLSATRSDVQTQDTLGEIVPVKQKAPRPEPECTIDVEVESDDTNDFRHIISLFFSHDRYAQLYKTSLKTRLSTAKNMDWVFSFRDGPTSEKHVQLLIDSKGTPPTPVLLQKPSQAVIQFTTEQYAKQWEAMSGLWVATSSTAPNERQLVATTMTSDVFRRLLDPAGMLLPKVGGTTVLRRKSPSPQYSG